MLGALLSKMDTIERYYVQVGVVSAVAVLCVVASIGSLMNRIWAAWLLTGLYGVAALFWLYCAGALAFDSVPGASGVGLATIPALIGILCATFSVVLFDYCRSSEYGDRY